MAKNQKIVLLTVLALLFSRLIFFSVTQYNQNQLCVISIANGLHSVAHQHLCIPNKIQSTEFYHSDFKDERSFPNMFRATLVDNGNGLVANTFAYFYTSISNHSWLIYFFLSFIFGIACIYLFKLSRLILDFTPSILVLLLFGFNPYIIEYSFHPRGYIYSVTFAIISTYLLLRILNSKEFSLARVSAYFFISLLATFSHFLVIAIFIGHGAFLLIHFRKISSKVFWSLILSLFFIPASVLLYMKGFDQIADTLQCQNEVYAERLKTPEQYNNYPMNLTPRVLFASLIQFLKPAFGLYANISLSIVLLISIPFFLLLFFFSKNSYKSKFQYQSSLISIIVLVFIGFSVGLAVANGHNLIFQEHYSIGVLPFALIIWISVISKLKLKNVLLTRLTLAYVFIITILSSANLFQYFFSRHYNAYNYENLAEELEANFQQGDLIVFQNYDDAQCINLFLSEKITGKQIINSNIDKVYILE